MKQRIALWDNIRLLLITLVVIGHFIDPLTPKSGLFRCIYMFMYAFHMPLFLFISGHHFTSKHIASKCLFYISLGFLLKIIIYISTVCTGSNTSFSLLSDGGIPWYLFVLAGYTLIAHLLRNQNKTYILIFSIILACFAGFDNTIGDQLYISRAIIFFPFFFAGTLFDSNRIIDLKRSKWLVAGAFTILLIWGILCVFALDDIYIFRHLMTGRNPFDSSIRSIGPLMRFLTYIISGLTSIAVIIITPNRNIPIITKMGSRSVDVYFWHWPLYVILNSFLHFSSLLGAGRMGMLLYLIIPVIFSIFLSSGGFISYPINQIKKWCFPTKE